MLCSIGNLAGLRGPPGAGMIEQEAGDEFKSIPPVGGKFTGCSKKHILAVC